MSILDAKNQIFGTHPCDFLFFSIEVMIKVVFAFELFCTQKRQILLGGHLVKANTS